MIGWNFSFWIGNRTISANLPTYFIADIGANHDGSLDRAKKLIKLAKKSGADCAKFQHFKAEKIVSAEGFEGLRTAHQAKWDKPVYEVYEQYSINRDWNGALAETCKEVGIDFMTTPYDLDAISEIDPLVKAYKIGSGDITYRELIEAVARRGKPIFLATGASDMNDVMRAAGWILNHNHNLCLMQCNTNYTGDARNFRYVNLNVLKTFETAYPGMILGLSDHTPGHACALGAVALGARVIEKHFTDDISRNGPDHAFAMMPDDWAKMRANVMLLERAMGDGVKRVEDNEKESAIVQRRALRVVRDIARNTALMGDDIVALRPCPEGALPPYEIDRIIGRKVGKELHKGDIV